MNPSVLLPETRSLLALWARTRPASPIIRERSSEDRKAYDAIRYWLEKRPHTAECRCFACRQPKEGAAQ